MEIILKNPGLQHITEVIFWNLSYEDLENCRHVNQSCKQILENPMFWLKKFVRRGLSKKNQSDWAKIIQLAKDSDIKRNICLYLKKCSKNERVTDLPCFINEDTVRNSKRLLRQFWNRVERFPKFKALEFAARWDAGILQIIAPLHNFATAANGRIKTMNRTSFKMVQIMAPLLEGNPNAPDQWGQTPMHYAANFGYVNLARLLVTLGDNPNAEDQSRVTPIYLAARDGNIEIVKMLAPLSDNPNTPDEYGRTPIHFAATNGNAEIIKILAPLSDKPNAPNVVGNTPIDLAITNGHIGVVRILVSCQKSAKRRRIERSLA